MHRRRLIRSFAGTVGVGGLAGCNGRLFGGDSRQEGRPGVPSASSERTEAGGNGGTASTASTTTPQPYRIDGQPSLDQPRGIHLENFGAAARFLTVVVTAGDDEVFVDTGSVPSGESVAFPALLGSRGEYRVLVETADGARRQFEWSVVEELGDLAVELRPDITFRRLARCAPGCAFLLGGSQESGLVSDVADFPGPEDRRPTLALDNDTERRQRVDVRLRDQNDRRFESTYTLPAKVRALLPVDTREPRYRVSIRTGGGIVHREWMPGVRSTLYAELGDIPRLRCGLGAHDVQFVNETDADQSVSVRVWTGDTADGSSGGDEDGTSAGAVDDDNGETANPAAATTREERAGGESAAANTGEETLFETAVELTPRETRRSRKRSTRLEPFGSGSNPATDASTATSGTSVRRRARSSSWSANRACSSRCGRSCSRPHRVRATALSLVLCARTSASLDPSTLSVTSSSP